MSDENGSGSAIGTILAVLAVVVLGVLALKATFWLVKTLLWVAIVGTVGYVGYSFIARKLTSDTEEHAPKALPPGSRPERADDDPLKEIDDALRELEQLKRDRGD